MLIRHPWQLKTIVFFHWHLICTFVCIADSFSQNFKLNLKIKLNWPQVYCHTNLVRDHTDGITFYMSKLKIRNFLNGAASFFTSSLILEGGTEKVLPFIIYMKAIYAKHFYFNEQKCIFEPHRKVKINNLKNFTIFLLFFIMAHLHVRFQGTILH